MTGDCGKSPTNGTRNVTSFPVYNSNLLMLCSMARYCSHLRPILSGDSGTDLGPQQPLPPLWVRTISVNESQSQKSPKSDLTPALSAWHLRANLLPLIFTVCLRPLVSPQPVWPLRHIPSLLFIYHRLLSKAKASLSAGK